MTALVVAWRFIAPILAFGITLPLWAFLVVGAWLYFDRSSAIRQAVNDAVTELVDGAELEAARAREEALRKILAEKDRQAERDRIALARFAELLHAAESEKDNLHDEIAELEAMPPPDACIVDDSLLDRLRNAR